MLHVLKTSLFLDTETLILEYVDLKHSVQYFYSRLLSKNVKIGIYKTIILPVVLYGCETWPLTLREEHIRRVFEKRVPRTIF
jgi:hypothetical protein